MKFIPQHGTDCGAACLAMVAAHYGAQPGLTRIRELAGTGQQGTDLSGLVKAGEALGFRATALKGDRMAFAGDLKLPLIAHLSLPRDRDKPPHFVVVSEVGGDHIDVLDPATERRRWSLEEFLRAWTGYVLFLEPREGASLAGKRFFAPLLSLLRPHRRVLAAIAAASLLLAGCGILGSLSLRSLIDDVLPSNSTTSVHLFSFAMMGLILLQASLEAVRRRLLAGFAAKVDSQVLLTSFEHLLSLPLKFFDSRNPGEILSRLKDGRKVRAALADASVTFLLDAAVVLLVGVFLFFQSAALFAIAAATVLLTSLLAALLGNRFSRLYREGLTEEAKVQGSLAEAVGGSASVKAHNAERFVFDRLRDAQQKLFQTARSAGTLRTLQQFGTGLLQGWGTTAVFWTGSLILLSGEITLGQLVSFNALLLCLWIPLRALLQGHPRLREALTAADRLGEVLAFPTEDKVEVSPDQAAVKGTVEFRQVSFRYGSRDPALRSVNLTVEPGRQVGLLGESGSGKSTVGKLLLRLYEPERGLITIGGRSLASWDPCALRSQIGYVSQDVSLFSGTAAENIALHRPFSREAVIDAARQSGADEFIERLPQGYDTPLRESDGLLSAGERQRLALARALIGSPALLILDEATSHLGASERRLRSALEERAARGTGILVLAHRLCDLAGCDRIYVLRQGVVVKSGTYRELVREAGD